MTPLLSITEAKDWLRARSDAAVLRLIREKGLPARKVGREYRIHPDDLERWFRAPAEVKQETGGVNGQAVFTPYRRTQK